MAIFYKKSINTSPCSTDVLENILRMSILEKRLHTCGCTIGYWTLSCVCNNLLILTSYIGHCCIAMCSNTYCHVTHSNDAMAQNWASDSRSEGSVFKSRAHSEHCNSGFVQQFIAINTKSLSGANTKRFSKAVAICTTAPDGSGSGQHWHSTTKIK